MGSVCKSRHMDCAFGLEFFFAVLRWQLVSVGGCGLCVGRADRNMVPNLLHQQPSLGRTRDCSFNVVSEPPPPCKCKSNGVSKVQVFFCERA